MRLAEKSPEADPPIIIFSHQPLKYMIDEWLNENDQNIYTNNGDKNKVENAWIGIN